MTPLSILAIATAAPDDDAALGVAADLAHRHASTARVINAFASLALPGPSFEAAVAGPSAWKRRGDDEEDARMDIRALVTKHAARLAGDGRANANTAIELAPGDDTAWAALMRELPLADMVVVGQSLAGGVGAFAGPLGDSLMEAKAPVYVARDAQAVAGRPAAVAWDGSLEAGHAVRAALPLLKEAS